jgi:hypothetical protein
MREHFPQKLSQSVAVCQGLAAIEILGAALEEACLKKGRIFSADLRPIL